MMKFSLWLENTERNPVKIKFNKVTGKLDGVPPGYAIRLTKLSRMHRGEELAKLVPERATHLFALHPDNWQYTFISLTGKDENKIGFYGPVAVPITPGTLVAEMSHATAFMYDGNPEQARLYKNSMKPISQINLSDYNRPELLIPPT